MAKLEDFYPHIEPYAPGLSDIQLDRALRDSIKTFCEESHALREDSEEFTLEPGNAEVELNPSESSQVQVIGVHELWVDGWGRLQPAMPGVLSASRSRGYVGMFMRLQNNTVTLIEPPLEARTGKALLSLCPLDDASTFSDRLLTDFRDAVVPGALGRLYRIPGTPSFSADAAATAIAIASGEIERARARAMLGNLRGNLRTTLVP